MKNRHLEAAQSVAVTVFGVLLSILAYHLSPVVIHLADESATVDDATVIGTAVFALFLVYFTLKLFFRETDSMKEGDASREKEPVL